MQTPTGQRSDMQLLSRPPARRHLLQRFTDLYCTNSPERRMCGCASVPASFPNSRCHCECGKGYIVESSEFYINYFKVVQVIVHNSKIWTKFTTPKMSCLSIPPPPPPPPFFLFFFFNNQPSIFCTCFSHANYGGFFKLIVSVCSFFFPWWHVFRRLQLLK